jgi:hypothetical protein
VTTANPGTTFTAPASNACTRLVVDNTTGTDLEYQRGGAGATQVIKAGTVGRVIEGLTNADQVAFRRVDTSNTTVTFSVEALNNV